MKDHSKHRRRGYGSVTVALTVLVVACAVILNAIVSTLAQRYSWYTDMDSSDEIVYSISDSCRNYFDGQILSKLKEDGTEGKIKVLFADEEKNVEQDDTLKYVLFSVRELEQMFPDAIELDFLNIWERPSEAREYGISSATDVAFIYDGRHTVAKLRDFFVFPATNSSTPTAYNGEKRIMASLLRVVNENSPMCYFTMNHGETLSDYELMFMVADAGYNYSFIDLLNQDIPEDCDLLITYNPMQDLTIADDVSSIDEVEKLEKYMSEGGKYMVFASADTFVSGMHANLESFLGGWGVKYDHRTGDDGIELCYNIKDSWHSLSTDGYTILGVGSGAELLGGSKKPNVFENATSISVSDGFVRGEDGSYSATIGGQVRKYTPLIYSYDTAEAWAGGKAVARADENPFTMMSISEQECEGGKTAYLVACGATAFGAEKYMQSIVYGNSDTMASVIKYMGKSDAPTSLTSKPFYTSQIQSITTAQANITTACLSVIPAVIVAVLGFVVLIKRRYS